jgi:carboxypeptidase C (cathepsin A)
VFPKDLVIGDASDQVMYSGYVNVTANDYLFYWFAEAQPGASSDAPLVVWSNGGPGCSAMEGMTTEHGPLVLYGVKEDGKLFSGKLSKNPNSWNQNAHVLYVDQPRYVGFSCGTGPFTTSSIEAGRDMVVFLRGWRLLFPEHAHREVVLATESYGGHYVPAWSTAILEYNEAGASDPIRLAGLIIGNGIVNDTIQGHSFPTFARRQGLIPSNNNTALQSSMEARDLMARYLGYQPNYYDYRLIEKECCGCSSYDYKQWANWLLRKDVTEALNVCGDSGAKAFGNCAAGCISMPDFDKDDTFDYSGAIGYALRKGIRVTFYYGMQDTACNYVGGYDMAAALPWPGASDFANAPFEDLLIGGAPSGKIKSAGGLTWMQVEGAGHMVPINNPAAASVAIGTLIPGASVDSCVGRAHKDGASSSTPHSDDEGDGFRYLQHLRRLYTLGHDGDASHLRLSEMALLAAAACAGVAIAALALGLRCEAAAAKHTRRCSSVLPQRHELRWAAVDDGLG